MNVSGASQVQALVQSMTAQENVKTQYQVGVLKKALDGQKDAANELLKLLDPRGQIVDVRA